MGFESKIFFSEITGRFRTHVFLLFLHMYVCMCLVCRHVICIFMYVRRPESGTVPLPPSLSSSLIQGLQRAQTLLTAAGCLVSLAWKFLISTQTRHWIAGAHLVVGQVPRVGCCFLNLSVKFFIFTHWQVLPASKHACPQQSPAEARLELC